MSGLPAEDMIGMVAPNLETEEIILKRTNAALQTIAKKDN